MSISEGHSPFTTHDLRFKRPHHRLDAWTISMGLVAQVHQVTSSFPADERFGLASQIRRAAVSIPCNIAEGAGRQSHKEFIQFLFMARGSATELETQLCIATRLGYVQSSINDQLNIELACIIHDR